MSLYSLCFRVLKVIEIAVSYLIPCHPLQELGRKRSMGGFLSLPKDEDRKHTLKKLLENLQEEAESQARQEGQLMPPASRFECSRPQSPETVPVVCRAPLSPASMRPSLATTSVPAVSASISSPSIRPDLRRTSAGDALKRSSPRLPGTQPEDSRVLEVRLRRCIMFGHSLRPGFFMYHYL